MKLSTAVVSLLLVMQIAVLWSVQRDLNNHPRLAARVRVGDQLQFPAGFLDPVNCTRVVAFDWSCGLCRVVPDEPGTVWLTKRPHPTDTLFGARVWADSLTDLAGIKGLLLRLVGEPGRGALWDGVFDVHGIPAEFLLAPDGVMLDWQIPVRKEPLRCLI